MRRPATCRFPFLDEMWRWRAMAGSQDDEDVAHALMHAASCLLHEADRGHAVEATRLVYARRLLVELDGDLNRLEATTHACQRAAGDNVPARPVLAQWNARAAELCERAAQMVVDAGAADDARARRRLLATCRRVSPR